MTKLPEKIPAEFSTDAYKKVLNSVKSSNGVRSDLGEMENLDVPWLSHYYLNSARLRTAFGFENTLAKFFSETDGKKTLIADRLSLLKGFVATIEQKQSSLFGLVVELAVEFGKSRRKNPADSESFENVLRTSSVLSQSRAFLLHFIWERVNEFKHRSSSISLQKTKSDFETDSARHRAALSIAIDFWSEVRQLTTDACAVADE
jgi:hypothetical protein